MKSFTPDVINPRRCDTCREILPISAYHSNLDITCNKCRLINQAKRHIGTKRYRGLLRGEMTNPSTGEMEIKKYCCGCWSWLIAEQFTADPEMLDGLSDLCTTCNAKERADRAEWKAQRVIPE